jgi:hypothetical protein
MKYKVHFPFVGNEDMLREAVDSVRSLENIHVWADGAPRPDVPGVTHHSLPPNGAAATINMALQSSLEDDVAFLMHSDALALDGGARQMLEFTRSKFESDEKWGVIFTLYDVFMAFNMKMVREIGYWDTRLYQYGTDDDYYYRMKLAGWSIVESAPEPGVENIDDKYVGRAHINRSVGVIHRGSSTVRLDSLFKYITDHRQPFNMSYYQLKWGGAPHHERFTRPFEDFYDGPTQGKLA